MDMGAAAREEARDDLIRRLLPFCEDSASAWLGGFLDASEKWPEGAELNDIFVVEENGPMQPLAEIRFWDLSLNEAPRRLADLFTVGLAYGNTLPPERVGTAMQLADDLVHYLGPTATWRISEEDWQTSAHGGRSKVSSDITGDTFSALLIGRGEHDVLVLVAADED